MARTTNKQIESLFGHFCKALGKRVATAYNDVGGWRLDHNSVYGGWNIEEISSTGGGVNHPFGPQRFASGAFWEMLRFGMHSAEIAKGRGGGGARTRRR